MDYELLSSILGKVEALFSLPLLRPSCASVCGWQAAYRLRGLPLGTDRQTAERLRVLTTAGHLATSGATQGKSWKLTALGVATARAALQLDNELPELFNRISELSARSKITLPGSTDRRLCMAWHLLPTAGAWMVKANRTDAAWRSYQSDLLQLLSPLSHLAMLGLVQVFVDVHGNLWGCAPTGEAPSWPDVPAPCVDGEACMSAWEQGFDAGIKYATRPAPADVSGTVPRLLPASAWQD